MTSASETPTLLDAQRWLRWAITHPQGPVHTLGEHPDAGHPTLTTEARFQEPLPRQLGMLTSVREGEVVTRLAVYADAYFLRLLECLASDFKTLARVAGADRFRLLVADYLRQFPSRSPSVGHLGHALPQFLRTHPLSQDYPFMPDLARLEWTVLESLFTNRTPVQDFSQLASVPEPSWAQARLHLNSTLRLLKTDYPVQTLWEHREAAEFTPDCPKSDQDLVVIRTTDWVQVVAVDRVQWFALEQFRDGLSLAAVCDRLTQRFETSMHPDSVMLWFTQWVQWGWITHILFGHS